MAAVAEARRLKPEPDARRWTALALLVNLPFVALRLHREAFDTYAHLFLADHYAQRWWQLWEPRWYLGFSVASYPPLAHQLIALLTEPLTWIVTAFAPYPASEAYPGAYRWAAAEAAFVLVLLAAACLFPIAVHALTRVFVGPRAAAWAATLAVLLPAFSLAGWAFGQLPTVLATGLVLMALARGAAFARTGQPLALAQAVALAAVTAAAHHAVFLLTPFVGLAVSAAVLQTAPAGARWRVAGRLALWAALSALAVAAMLWPFLLWSRGQTLQTPIDHPSRYNFLAQPMATLFFFWPIHGPGLLLIPPTLALAWRRPRLWALAAAWLTLFGLSLGGTTPLPRWLFGAGWEWLTYDRLGLWAAAVQLPLIGALLTALTRRPGWRARTPAGYLLACAVATALSGGLSALTQAQPARVDLTPLIRFLNAPAQQPYRFITLGFGEQFAKLTALTQNGTPDGQYHTARALPELRISGLGALDGAVWNPQGAWAVAPFLQQAPRYGLRWAFVVHPAYVPVLEAAGWTPRFFVGAAQAWERAEVAPVPSAPPAEDPLAAGWWGAAPLTAALLAALALAWPHRAGFTPAAGLAVLGRLRRALWPMLIAACGLWWVHVARAPAGDLPHIYYVYQSVLIYGSDVIAAGLVGIWAIEHLGRRQPLRLPPVGFAAAGAAVGAALLASTAASTDPAQTLAFAAQAAVLGGLAVMAYNDPPARGPLLTWLAVLAAAQGGLAVWQAITQTSAIPTWVAMPWPGAFDAATPGASVVVNGLGERWLRAYGTLPHPNVLGGVLAALAGPLAAQAAQTGRRRWWVGLGLVVAALGLTFSRAAWLAGAAALAGLAGLAPRAAWPRLRPGLLGLALAAAGTAILLAPFLLTRLGLNTQPPAVERASTLERALLLQYGWQAWRAQPITGVGAGAFVQWAARTTGEALPFQPVHNVPVLALAEAGVLGGAAVLALGGAVAWRLWRRRHAHTLAEAGWAAAAVAVAVTAQFDHFWWTLAPARTLAVLLLALWLAEAGREP